MVGQESLQAYYLNNVNLSFHHKYSVETLDNMIPLERAIYLSLIEQYITEQNKEFEKHNQSGQRVEYQG